ncbi:Anoctamin, partial [Caligus rogercresseyi]
STATTTTSATPGPRETVRGHPGLLACPCRTALHRGCLPELCQHVRHGHTMDHPNFNTGLKEKIRREAYLTNEIIIRTELLKARGSSIQRPWRRRFTSWKRRTSGRKKEGSRYDLNKIGRTETGDITDGQIIL